MERTRPELHVIAGPNGAGKTTITERLLSHNLGKGVVYVNPDAIAQSEFRGWNDVDSIRAAAEIAEKRRFAAIADRKSLAFETVFSTPEKVEFVRMAIGAGYFVRFYFVCTSRPGISADRVATRTQIGGHLVPLEKIISRYPKSIANAALVVPHVDRAYIYDNSIHEQHAREILRVKDGFIYKTDNDLPTWAAPIRDAVLMRPAPEDRSRWTFG